jgi:inosine-uridine nucleoside N-ribohydrolase
MNNAHCRLARFAPILLGAACFVFTLATAAAAEPARPKPVILDTDIGDDIDDTWALGVLLQSPELDLKLVVGDYGKTDYRAKVLAKFLQAAGRSDVPVGKGLNIDPRGDGPQARWVKDYDLASYPGKVIDDGVQALIDTIMKSPEPITLICIGPVPNIAAALAREPKIAERARFVGMYGSVRVGYGGSSTPAAEWNVKADPKACAKAFTAAWDMTITPLETCGLVDLAGDRYRRVRDSANPIAAAVIENYRLWSTHADANNKAADSHSSVLFDTVAIYLACSQDLCRMERLGLRVNDQGFTVPDDAAKKINAAMAWKDLDGYRDWLVTRLTTKRAAKAE